MKEGTSWRPNADRFCVLEALSSAGDLRPLREGSLRSDPPALFMADVGFRTLTSFKFMLAEASMGTYLVIFPMALGASAFTPGFDLGFSAALL